MSARPLGWLGIFRLGLVQTSLGAIVVLTTSTLNRIMVVELALPAMLPGALVAIHYALQFLRPRLGHGSDVGGRRTPWIVGGMMVLAAGGMVASLATAWMATDVASGIALAVAGFVLIGVGVGAAGTSLLVLLAKRVDDRRRAPAATIVWIMMIAGFAVTAGVAGHLLDPYTPARLVAVTGAVCAIAMSVTVAALWGVEGHAAPVGEGEGREPKSNVPFREALAQVWDETQSRRFTVFIFVSMLAYGAQDLILEPFAGAVFALTPGQSTKLSGVQHGGVLAGMLLVAVVCGVGRGGRPGLLRLWTLIGCGTSAIALFGLAAAGFVGPSWPLNASVFFLGVANGTYAIAAIGSMMALVVAGHPSREGVRMGLWGAAQALAFGSGGFLGTVAIDLARGLTSSPVLAYSAVFASEGVLFLVAAWLAARVDVSRRDETASQPVAEDARAPAFALETRGA
ncbi:MAG: BCD family MFS transporter [Betaproteobacteria bacterium]|nr:BCD family MFS transporter [Betaproteobacteria bacterium]